VRPTKTLDASAGPVNADVTLLSGVSCTIQPLSSKEKLAFAQRQVYLTHRAYFSQDIAPQRADRLDAADGRSFQIFGYFNLAGRSRVWAAELREQTT
jgi:hypothetical protein